MAVNATPSVEQTTAELVVEYYGAAWSAYVFAALVFLAIVIWFTRKGKAWWRIPLWAAIAAGSLTPAATSQEQTWQAPAIIVAILGFDLNGMAGLAQGLVPIITWFVGFALFFSIVHVVMQKWPRKTKKAIQIVDDDKPELGIKQEPKM